MVKTMTAAVKTEAAKLTGQRVRHLAELHFSPVVYLTDHTRIVPWNSNNYQPGGHFLSYSDIGESTEVRVGNYNLVLSSVEQTYVATLLQNNYIDRQVVIRRFWLDGNDQMIDGPVIVRDGRIQGFSLDEQSRPPKVVVNVATHWADFDKVAGRRSTEASQQRHFADDRFFEFAAERFDDKVWGRA